ncbi:methionyl-tRNA formyltransferase [Endozoicomonas montiporae]|uniref:Methionyl-tRNA formyltransferase n=2 Tax=Endozoicomonas montiporae TaxID=1027273 RepID=A0A081N067_9GAMM|nr:methionyl-tRNA formyltransferase [Endozoicomonas montiporae]AMO54290.1 methionyl-tRNA formyltransferase [Endozoicomonas montiporae CL-33]KEQ11840.1 methionyl-tRNA formyltransferase [Endozoicomonas montiporae]
MKSLKIVFAGTPDFASAHLQAVLDTHHEVIAVYTQPDRPAGRGRKLKPSPVKELALQHSIPVYQPKTLRDETVQQELADLGADLMIVVAYGLILPQVVLDTPKHGCINVHGSILPRWRGAAPIQRAIAAGDEESGVTIMQMDAGLDTGNMLIKAYCPINTTDTSSDLHDRLIEVGQPALVEAVHAIAEGTLEPEKQDDNLACYAHKMSKEEAQIDWSKTAGELHNLVRAFNPWPVATAEFDGLTIRVWEAAVAREDVQSHSDKEPGALLKADKEGLDIACQQGILRVTKVQLPGSKAMAVSDLLNSKKELFTVGKRFN